MNAQITTLKLYQIEVARLEAQIAKLVKTIAIACIDHHFSMTIMSQSAIWVSGVNEQFQGMFYAKCPTHIQDCLQIHFMANQLEKAQNIIRYINTHGAAA